MFVPLGLFGWLVVVVVVVVVDIVVVVVVVVFFVVTALDLNIVTTGFRWMPLCCTVLRSIALSGHFRGSVGI